jgi:hypothetical protein
MGGGGSGGGTYSSGDSSVKEIKQQIRDAESQAIDKGFESALADTLGTLLGKFNDRDAVSIRKRASEILKSLGKEFEGSLETLFGGSVAKHTYVDGISDIDSLLILNKSELADSSPQQVLEYISDALRKHLKDKAEVSAGKMAVTVKYPDGMELQMLPAIKTGDSIKVPASRRDGWSSIDPTTFTTALTRHNERCDGKLVPMIKLAKAINDKFPEQQRLSGYHIESLAIEAFRGYTGEKVVYKMLPHLFDRAVALVLKPINDKTGQSLHVDDYMGTENSPERQRASHLLGRVAKRMKNASATRSMEDWKGMFDN